MLGFKKKRKTGAQIAQDIGDSLAVKVKSISERNLHFKMIYISCIIIFSLSICFGVYGLASRHSDISKKKQGIEKLRSELSELEARMEESRALKERLISDTLAIEAVARSYGMSKSGERIFYFLD